jgi:hypothetical protein
MMTEDRIHLMQAELGREIDLLLCRQGWDDVYRSFYARRREHVASTISFERALNAQTLAPDPRYAALRALHDFYDALLRLTDAQRAIRDAARPVAATQGSCS